jgi:hypothetical protein
VLRFVIYLFLLIQYAHGYEACNGSFNSGCNKDKIENIQDQLKDSLKGNTDFVFMELIRQKALEKYDLYALQVEKNISCFNTVMMAESCSGIKSKNKKCNEAIASYPKCVESVGPIYNDVLAQNVDMRISLSLWNPPGKPHEYNNRPEDKYRTKVKHLNYVEGNKLGPLTKEESELSAEIFDIEQDNSFKQFLKKEIEEKNKREKKNSDWQKAKAQEKLVKKLKAKRNRKKRHLRRKGHTSEEIKILLYDPRIDDPQVASREIEADIVISDKQLEAFKKTKSFIDIMRYDDAIKEHKINMMDRYKYIYLETVLNNPVLKHITKHAPGLEDVKKGFVELSKSLNKNRDKILNLEYDDLEQLLFFEPMVEEVLSENPFFCLNAINKKEQLEDTRELKENLFAFGGLVLCPFTGYGCAGAMFGGSVVNFLDSKERLDATMEYAGVPDMVSIEEVTGQAQKQGMAAGMVLLSTPVSLIGKVAFRAIGTDVIATSMKGYITAVREEGLKRIIIKTPVTSDAVYKNAFKQLKNKPNIHDLLDIIVQAPVVGVTKLLTKKAYTFQPAEFAIKKLETKLFKGKAEFSGPVSYLGNFVDFRLFVVGYGAAIMHGKDFLDRKPGREQFAGKNFDSYELDPRFSKVKEIEKACKISESCKEDIDLIVKYNNNLVLDGVMVFSEIEKSYDKKVKSKEIKKDSNLYLSSLLANKELHDYGSQLFPNFYEYYPNGPDSSLSGEAREKQRSVFLYDVLRLKIAQEIQQGGIDNFLSEKEISTELGLFIKSNPEVGKILTSETDSKIRRKKIGDSLNDWVRFNQEYILQK